jgi:vacuolar-type H+-ATPase subunit F/Vma7
MGRLAAIGTPARVSGLALAGVLVSLIDPDDNPDLVRAAWRDLPPDVDVVILTPQAASTLDDEVRPARLVAVLP